MSTSLLSKRFSLTQAKSLVKDLSKPVASIYWADFIASITIGHLAFVSMLLLPQWTTASGAPFWAMKCGLFAVAAVLYMRSTMFIHELVHLPRNGFQGFRIAWNVLCGIPFFIPSFLYYPHVDHHRRKHYATDRDGEYLDLSHRHPANVFVFVGAALVVPIAAFLRFAVMAPLSWVIPGFRSWVEKRASSMIIDIFYLRDDFGPSARKIMRVQEVACFVWAMALIVRGVFFSSQLIDVFTVQAYLMAVTLVLINNVRTLGAHRWMGDGRELTFEEQLLDSVNYPYRAWITELWGPVGTRYHAIHHLFPSLPYHNLGIAHRRLMAGLPEDSMYRDTVRVSLVGAILELWERASHRHDTAEHIIVTESDDSKASAA